MHKYYFICCHQVEIDETRTELCEIFVNELKRKTDKQDEIEVINIEKNIIKKK